MSVAARLFVFISELGFFIFMIIVPMIYSGSLIVKGDFPLAGMPLVLFGAGLLSYWFLIICFFGAVALMAENNKTLKNIEELLQKQGLRKDPPNLTKVDQPVAARTEPTFKS